MSGTEPSFLVLTAIGSDRVGIVDDLARMLADRRCNIEESRMSVLGGEFAVIMLVSAGADAAAALHGEAGRIGEAMGLHLQVRPTVPPRPAPGGRPYLIETVSLDAPGIVHALAAILKGFGVNIEEMETETSAAPWTGAPMFHLRAHVVLPSQVHLAEVKEALLDLERERDLDVRIEPLPGGAME